MSVKQTNICNILRWNPEVGSPNHFYTIKLIIARPNRKCKGGIASHCQSRCFFFLWNADANFN